MAVPTLALPTSPCRPPTLCGSSQLTAQKLPEDCWDLGGWQCLLWALADGEVWEAVSATHGLGLILSPGCALKSLNIFQLGPQPSKSWFE